VADVEVPPPPPPQATTATLTPSVINTRFICLSICINSLVLFLGWMPAGTGSFVLKQLLIDDLYGLVVPPFQPK